MVVAGGMEKWIGIVHVLYFYSSQQFFFFFLLLCLFHLLLFIRAQFFVDSLPEIANQRPALLDIGMAIVSIFDSLKSIPYAIVIGHKHAYIPGGVNQCLYNCQKFMETG